MIHPLCIVIIGSSALNVDGWNGKAEGHQTKATTSEHLPTKNSALYSKAFPIGTLIEARERHLILCLHEG